MTVQASVLLALQNLDAKYRDPLVAELLSMSRELRRLAEWVVGDDRYLVVISPGRMVHGWFIPSVWTYSGILVSLVSSRARQAVLLEKIMSKDYLSLHII